MNPIGGPNRAPLCFDFELDLVCLFVFILYIFYTLVSISTAHYTPCTVQPYQKLKPKTNMSQKRVMGKQPVKFGLCVHSDDNNTNEETKKTFEVLAEDSKINFDSQSYSFDEIKISEKSIPSPFDLSLAGSAINTKSDVTLINFRSLENSSPAINMSSLTCFASEFFHGKDSSKLCSFSKFKKLAGVNLKNTDGASNSSDDSNNGEHTNAYTISMFEVSNKGMYKDLLQSRTYQSLTVINDPIDSKSCPSGLSQRYIKNASDATKVFSKGYLNRDKTADAHLFVYFNLISDINFSSKSFVNTRVSLVEFQSSVFENVELKSCLQTLKSDSNMLNINLIKKDKLSKLLFSDYLRFENKQIYITLNSSLKASKKSVSTLLEFIDSNVSKKTGTTDNSTVSTGSIRRKLSLFERITASLPRSGSGILSNKSIRTTVKTPLRVSARVSKPSTALRRSVPVVVPAVNIKEYEELKSLLAAKAKEVEHLIQSKHEDQLKFDELIQSKSEQDLETNRLSEEINDKNSHLEKLNNEFESLQHDIDQIKEENTALKKENEKFTEELQTKENLISKTKTELKQKSEELEQLQRRLKAEMDAVDLMTKELNITNHSSEGLVAQLESFKNAQQNLERQIIEKDSKLESLEIESKHKSIQLHEMKNEISQLKVSLDNSREVVASGNSEFEKSKKQEKKLKDLLSSKQDEINSLKEEHTKSLEAIKKDLKSSNKKSIQELKNELNTLQETHSKELESLRKEVHDKTEEVDNLKQQLKSALEKQSPSKSAKKQKDKSSIKHKDKESPNKLSRHITPELTDLGFPMTAPLIPSPEKETGNQANSESTATSEVTKSDSPQKSSKSKSKSRKSSPEKSKKSSKQSTTAKSSPAIPQLLSPYQSLALGANFNKSIKNKNTIVSNEFIPEDPFVDIATRNNTPTPVLAPINTAKATPRQLTPMNSTTPNILKPSGSSINKVNNITSSGVKLIVNNDDEDSENKAPITLGQKTMKSLSRSPERSPRKGMKKIRKVELEDNLSDGGY